MPERKKKLKRAQLKEEEFQSNFSSELKTLNPDFTEQSSQSWQNLEKALFKMKSYDDNILYRKKNSNPTSHYSSVYH